MANKPYILISIALFTYFPSIFFGGGISFFISVSFSFIIFLVSINQINTTSIRMTLYIGLLLILLVYSLVLGDVIRAANGFRLYFLPIVYYFAGKKFPVNLYKFRKYIIFIIISTVPLGFLTDYIWVGSIQSLTSRTVVDGFGAYFGKATGILGLFLCVLISQIIYYLIKKDLSFISSILLLILIMIAIILAEFKFAFYVLPILALFILLFNSKNRNSNFMKLLLYISSTFIILLSLFNFLYADKLYKSSLDDLLFTEETYRYSAGNDPQGQLGRTGLLNYTIENVLENFDSRSLFGYGLGTAADQQSKILSNQATVQPKYLLHHIAFCQLLWETGVFGLLFVIVTFITLMVRLRKVAIIKKNNLLLVQLAHFLYIYCLIILISFPYNSAFFHFSFMSVFWFFYAQLELRVPYLGSLKATI